MSWNLFNNSTNEFYHGKFGFKADEQVLIQKFIQNQF